MLKKFWVGIKKPFQKLWQIIWFVPNKIGQKINLSSSFEPNTNFLDLKIVKMWFLIFVVAAGIISLSIFIYWLSFGIYSGTFDSYFNFNSQSWNRLFFETLKLPSSILVGLIPIIALLAAAHRSEQTKAQIEKTSTQIQNTNIQIKQSEFFKGLDNLAEDSLVKVGAGVRQLTILKNLTEEQKEIIQIAFIQRLKNPLTKIIKNNNDIIKSGQPYKAIYFNYGRYILDWLTTNDNIKDNDLNRTNFDYQEFSKDTDFSIFEKSDFHFSFVRARLSEVDFSNISLISSDLSYANLHNINFSDAKLRCTDLSNTDLSYAKLGNADLRYANLSDANLFGAKLGKKDNEDSNIFGSFPGTTDFDLANLSKTKLNKGVIEKYNLQLTEEQEKVIAWV